MLKELELLIRLQTLDELIKAKEKDQKEIPQNLEEIKKKVAMTEKELEEIQKKLKELELTRRKKEKYLDELAEKITDKKAKLFNVKTNEEYAALLREIEKMKEETSQTEDEIIILLDEIEVTHKLIEEKEKKVKEIEELLRKKEKEFEEIVDKIAQEIESFKNEREEIRQQLGDDTRKLYEKIKGTRGNAVVRASNKTCMGCFMEIPPQTFLEVKKGDKLIQCPFCGRILFFWEEKKEDEEG
ncbi:MAG: hypothetical protein GXO44_05125 [Deferribacteres bacterium]|nr:hypothetical protein [Deferribacteres bacterium]